MKCIKIVFLFQVASFWPNCDSLYRSCVNDERLEVKLIFLNESGTEKSQMQSAEKFLIDNNMEYVNFDDFDLEGYKPDYVVYQTPYLEHRRGNMRSWSANMIRLGARVIYIPYGLEIADNKGADYVHFKEKLELNCFRIYTFSEEMKKIYDERCFNAQAVKALGMPKFDGLFHKEQFPLDSEIKEKSNGRKIILWKVHFVKTANIDGRQVQISPSVEEYFKFAKVIESYPELFFIFMPHPKMRECDPQTLSYVDGIFECIDKAENAVVDMSDDYRNSLVNADAMIVDRSSLMVEGATVGCPIMFISNSDYEEPFNKPIQRLIDTYYRGNNYEDMVEFVNMVSAAKDPKREERINEFNRVIPHFNGFCGEQIKNDLITSYAEPYYRDYIKFNYIGKKIAIWGTGYIASQLYWFLLLGEKTGIFEVSAYIDNNKQKCGKHFQGKKIYAPSFAQMSHYDYIILAVDGKEGEITEQLFRMGVSKDKIINYDLFLVGVTFGIGEVKNDTIIR